MQMKIDGNILRGVAGDVKWVGGSIENRTDQNVVVRGIYRSCTCQDVQIRGVSMTVDSRLVIERDETVPFRMRVVIPGGQRRLRIRCHTDHPEFPIVSCEASSVGNIPFRLDKDIIDLGDCERGRVYRFSTEGTCDTVDVHSVYCEDNNGSVTVGLDNSFEVAGEVQAHSEGEFIKRVVVRSKESKYATELVVVGHVPRTLRCDPAVLSLGVIEKEETVEKWIRLVRREPGVNVTAVTWVEKGRGTGNVKVKLDSARQRVQVVGSGEARGGVVRGLVRITYDGGTCDVRVAGFSVAGR